MYAHTRGNKKQTIVKTKYNEIIQSLHQILPRLLNTMRSNVNHPLRALKVSPA
jgi:hypothetical protein